MTDIMLTTRERSVLDELKKKKQTAKDIAKKFGIDERTVITVIGNLRGKKINVMSFRPGSRDNKIYWVDDSSLLVPTLLEGNFSTGSELGKALYEPVKAIGEILASKESQKRLEYTFDETIGIIGLADSHIGHPNGYLEMIKTILMDVLPKVDGLYVIFMGDLIDNSMNAFAPSGCSDIINKEGQMSILEYLLEPLRGTGKILAWCEGNHEYRSFKTDHFRPTEYLANGFGGLYCKHGATFSVNVNGNKTVLYASHKLTGGSQFNPLHPNIRAALFDKAPEAGEADVIWRAHTHESAVGQFRVGAKDRIMLVCGNSVSYDEYADRHGFSAGISGYPVLILRKNGERLFFKDTMTGIHALQIFRGVDGDD